MGVLGGKINDDLWIIETNSIDTDTPSGFPSKCSSHPARERGSRKKSVCTCAKQSSVVERLVDTGAVSGASVLAADKGLDVSEQRRKINISNKPSNPCGDHHIPRGPYVNKKYQLYKTEMCRSHTEMGYCRYGDKCQFAHSESELRYVQRHPKYKTETCKTFWEEGSCPYGKRCCFIHIPNTASRIIPPRMEHKDSGDSDGEHVDTTKTKIDSSAQDEVICTRIDEPGAGDYGAGEKVHTAGSVDHDMKITFLTMKKHKSNRPSGAGGVSSFEPAGGDEETMARRPFWETNNVNIWMGEEPPLFYLDGSHKIHPRGGHLAPGGPVCRTFSEDVSEFVLRHLDM